jgi:hypothetical protein
MSRALVRLYPRWWRARYREEFVALLDEHGFGLACVLDIVRGAADARIRGDGAASLDSRQRGALGAALCTAAALAPIAAVFSRLPEDAGIVDAANRHPLVALSLVVVALGVMATAVFGLGGTLIFGGLALREARRTHRRELALPLRAVGVGVLLLIGVEAIVGIYYSTLTPAQRLNGTTSGILIAWGALSVLGLAMCAGGLSQAVRRTQLDPDDASRAAALAWAVAGSAAGMLAGATAWGLAMLTEAPAAFAPIGTLAWLAMLAVNVLALGPALIALARCRRPRLRVGDD